MIIEYLKGAKAVVPDDDVALFWEWHSIICAGETGASSTLDDGFDGASYQAAFALGYDLAIRTVMRDALDLPGENNPSC